MKIGAQAIGKIGEGRVHHLLCKTINLPEIQREWKLTLGVPKLTTLTLIVDGSWSLREMPDRVAVAAPINNTQKGVIKVLQFCSPREWPTTAILAELVEETNPCTEVRTFDADLQWFYEKLKLIRSKLYNRV